MLCQYELRLFPQVSQQGQGMFIRRHENAQKWPQLLLFLYLVSICPSRSTPTFHSHSLALMDAPIQATAQSFSHWNPVTFNQWGQSTEMRRRKMQGFISLARLTCIVSDQIHIEHLNSYQVHFLYKPSFFLMKVPSSLTCLFRPNKGKSSNMAKTLVIPFISPIPLKQSLLNLS